MARYHCIKQCASEEWVHASLMSKGFALDLMAHPMRILGPPCKTQPNAFNLNKLSTAQLLNHSLNLSQAPLFIFSHSHTLRRITLFANEPSASESSADKSLAVTFSGRPFSKRTYLRTNLQWRTFFLSLWQVQFFSIFKSDLFGVYNFYFSFLDPIFYFSFQIWKFVFSFLDLKNKKLSTDLVHAIVNNGLSFLFYFL